MTYFRRYLIALRRMNNDGLFWNFQAFLGIVSFVLCFLSILVDYWLPFNYFTNTLKGFVALFLGFILFSFLYLVMSRITEKKIDSDKYYNPIRNRFSHKQRVNISTVLLTLGIFILLVSNPNSPIFTLKSGLFISTCLGLLAFSRKQRDEFIKEIYEIPDYRDIKKKNKVEEENEDNK